MNIADAELAYIKTSGTVTFQSILGNIDVAGIIQASEMTQATTSPVEIIASAAKTVTFKTASSTFHTLTVTSAGGIAVEHDLATSFGNLAMTSSGAALALSSGVDLISKSAMTLNGHSITVVHNITCFTE